MICAPETETADLALELREDGKTYQEIALELGVSKGKAHHLVRRARSSDRSEAVPRTSAAADRSERDLRVVLMRQEGVAVRKVAAVFGITDRQVRRIMKRWREGGVRRDKEAVASVESRLDEFAKALHETERRASRSDDPAEHIAGLTEASRLITEMNTVARDGGRLSQQHLILDLMCGCRRAREDERIEMAREVNAGIRDLFSRCSQPDFEQVSDVVIDVALGEGADIVQP